MTECAWVPIGSVLFQTVGFNGGRVTAISDTYNTTALWVQDILDAHSAKNFVKRILYPDSYPVLQISEEEHVTHLMTWAKYSDGYVVYPRVVCKDLENCTELVQLSDAAAFKFALTNGEYIYFTNATDADLFLGNWKIAQLASEWFDEEGNLYKDAYLVNVGGESIPVWSCDHTEYEIGDWVALAKVGTEFPTEGEGGLKRRVPVTNLNVPVTGKYVIVPYRFAGL